MTVVQLDAENSGLPYWRSTDPTGRVHSLRLRIEVEIELDEPSNRGEMFNSGHDI